MNKKIIIAGSGGQGILFLGKVLAFACMVEGKKVTWFPSYGAEMRGGTANCTVVISDRMIGSPVALKPDLLIVMNRASLEKFQSQLKKNGTLFFDSSLIADQGTRDDVRRVSIPATKIASLSGNTKSANVVMLGAFIAETGILKKASVTRIFEDPLGPWGKIASKTNVNSFLEGIQYIENSEG
ncbi:MAG: 2-oxoacid:acceptor oxidoreductase family protein [Nitrospirae bacterium]|nr:2-oxoacid:acceptor oxidoreductase family protein [Nitrospirota bacterium]